MNSLIETLNQFGGQFLQFAWPMLWQSSLLIAFVFVLDFLLAWKIRASVRYALWLAVLVKLLLPPTLALPTGAAWWLFHAQPVAKAPAIKNYTVTYDTTPLADYIPPTVALPPPAPPQLNGAGWAMLAAGTISAGLLLWLVFRWWQVARMVRGAIVAEGLADLMEEVRRQAGLRSRIRLKLVEGRMSPAVCGLFRPVILLPRALAQNLSAAQLRAVLLHEAFHLRRKDVWVNCAQALLQIVYWWHPLLWIANARIRRVREEAVDDAVMLALRDEADSYAPTLLEVAKLAFRRPLMSLGLVGIMESRSALRQRIERLVDFHAPRKAGLTLASLCGICVFSAVALPMGEAPLRDKSHDIPLNNETNSIPNTIPLLSTETNNLIQPTEAAIADLKKQLVSGDENTRRLALIGFGMSPLVKKSVAENPTLGEALPILIQATEDESYLVRLAAVSVLWQIKSSDQRVVEALGNLVTIETNLGTATMATSILKEIGPSAAPAVPDLIMILEQRKPDGTLVSAVNDQIKPNIPLGTALRRAAIEALGNIGPAAHSAIPVLRHLLNDTGEFAMGDHVFSAKALWQITGETNESLPVLINALEKENSFWAADILGMMSADAKPAIPALQNAIQNGDGYIRLRSALALHKIEPGFSLPSPLLLDLLKDENSTTRYEAADAIWSANHDASEIIPTLIDLIKPNQKMPLWDLDYESDRAIQLLGEIGPQAKAAVSRLKEIIQENRDANIRQLATEALGKIEGNSGESLDGPKSSDASKIDPGQLVQDGKLLFEMGKLDEAEVKLSEAVNLDASNATACYYLNLVKRSQFQRAWADNHSNVITQAQGKTNGHAAGILYTGKGRQAIVNKLDHIRLDNFSADNLPLSEVLRILSQLSKLRDPEHKGINFVINSNSDQTVAGMIDSATGLPVTTNGAPVEDVAALPPITFALTNVTLGDVLDAIVVTCDHPIKYDIRDFAVVFSAKGPETPQLFARSFKVDPLVFYPALQGMSGLKTNSVTAMARSFFTTLGVNLESPPGKSVFYNDRLGALFVRATAEDLDTIGRAISAMMPPAPQIHIKARFYEMPKGTMQAQGALNGFQKISGANNSPAQITGILNATNARAAMWAFQSRSGIKVLAEPEVTTTSGRQTQMRATEVVTVITNMAFYDTFTNQDGLVVSNSIVPQTSQLETGPILDVVPYVLSDGYTINLTLIPSLTEFLGYDTPTNTTAAYNRDGEKIDVPRVLPRFTVRQTVTSVNLWDNQTVIIGGLPQTTHVGGSVVPGKSKTNDKELLIFITATIVDPAGNRVHSDDDLPFAQMSVPSQPQNTVSDYFDDMNPNEQRGRTQ